MAQLIRCWCQPWNPAGWYVFHKAFMKCSWSWLKYIELANKKYPVLLALLHNSALFLPCPCSSREVRPWGADDCRGWHAHVLPTGPFPSPLHETQTPPCEAILHLHSVTTAGLFLKGANNCIFNDCARNCPENKAWASEGWGFFVGVSWNKSFHSYFGFLNQTLCL